MAKSQIDEATVKRIAHLSRLRISAQEAQSLKRELNGILAWVEELNAIPTGDVEPLTHAGAAQLRMRTDVVTDGGRPPISSRTRPNPKTASFSSPRLSNNPCH